MPRITINEINRTTRTPVQTSSALPVAIIGTATKGAINAPTDVVNIREFYRIFGSSVPTGSARYGYIAAYEVLMSGGPVLYTRIADTTTVGTKATAASVTIRDAGDTKDVLKVTASSEGTWGNNLAVTITQSDTNYLMTVLQNSTVVNSFVFSLSGLPVSNDYVTVVKVSDDTTAPDLVTGTPLTGGLDGDDMKPDDIHTAISSVLDMLVDSSLYTFISIAAPGLSGIKNTSSSTVANLFADFSKKRTDAVCILDPLESSTSSSVISDLALPALDTLTDTNGLTGVAIFFPWYTANADITGANESLPPSIFYLTALANSQTNGQPWEAIAGPYAGAIPGVLSTAVTVGSVMSDSLNDQCINPIVLHRNYGYFIDGNSVYNSKAGNRTMAQLSIRMAINYAKQTIADICTRLSYRPNSDTVKTEFMGQTTAILESMKTSEALYGYTVTINESETNTADGVINATIKLFPTPATEEFILNFEIVNVESAL